MDELKISNSARSSDWIKTEYHNQSNTSTSPKGAPSSRLVTESEELSHVFVESG